MELDYHTAPKQRLAPGDFGTLVLQAVAAYFVASILTLPFLNAIWLGEVPLLALVQLPKVVLAGWLRTDVVMPAIGALGLSRGSFSPDYGMARPYALALAYLVVLGVLFGTLRITGRMPRARFRWACVTLLVAAVDFAFTLWFADGPALTIY